MHKQPTKMWEVLVEAKKLLLTELPYNNHGFYQYICHSIEGTKASKTLHKKTVSYVLDLIQPCYSFESWMGETIGYYKVNQDIEENNQKKLQKARHDFVDWMISDLKSKNL